MLLDTVLVPFLADTLTKTEIQFGLNFFFLSDNNYIYNLRPNLNFFTVPPPSPLKIYIVWINSLFFPLTQHFELQFYNRHFFKISICIQNVPDRLTYFDKADVFY